MPKIDPHHVIHKAIAEFPNVDSVDDFDRDVIKICLMRPGKKEELLVEYSYEKIEDGRVSTDDIREVCRKALLRHL